VLISAVLSIGVPVGSSFLGIEIDIPYSISGIISLTLINFQSSGGIISCGLLVATP
jgi:hypothetical protein